MNIDGKKAAILAASFFLGGAEYAAVTSGAGRRSCVSLVGKGIKLKNRVAYSLATAKEGIDDIIAEAKENNGEKCCRREDESSSKA
jgi:hypothetical protein